MCVHVLTALENGIFLSYICVWHKNFKWNLVYGFTVSGTTIKLKSVNWCPHNASLATVNVRMCFDMGNL